MEEIYLDVASTTKPLTEISNYLDFYGNSSSKHNLGIIANKKIEEVRKKIAKEINCKPSEIIFTSGATESNNLILRGLFNTYSKKHIITSAIEHSSILETCKLLEKKGAKVDYLKVDSNGQIDLEELKEKISKETLVVSIMHVNNEIGTIQNLKEIGNICKKNNVLFHSDCVQSFTKLKIDVNSFGLSSISVSGHKFNALKGIGFLYLKENIKIIPEIIGGKHEKGFRSGTLNNLGIISLGLGLDKKRDKKSVKEIRDYLEKELLNIKGSKINSPNEDKRIYNNLNISFKEIDSEELLIFLNENKIYASSGSSCLNNKDGKSYVLKEIGVKKDYINGAIRITIDEEVSLSDAKKVILKIRKGVEKQRQWKKKI